MELNKYQDLARRTAIYPKMYSVIYPALGLAGETGETCEKIKKLIRDDDFDPECYTTVYIDSIPQEWEDKREEIKKELGDILWYVANLAHDFNLQLEDIAQLNIDKLKSRQNRNKLGGSGDNR